MHPDDHSPVRPRRWQARARAGGLAGIPLLICGLVPPGRAEAERRAGYRPRSQVAAVQGGHQRLQAAAAAAGDAERGAASCGAGAGAEVLPVHARARHLRFPRPQRPGRDRAQPQAGRRPGPAQPAVPGREQGLPALPARQGRVCQHQQQRRFRRWVVSATTSAEAAAEMSVPAEPDPGRGPRRHCRRGVAATAAAVTGQIARWPAATAAALGEKAAPARKRFRNHPSRTAGAQARSAAPEKE